MQHNRAYSAPTSLDHLDLLRLLGLFSLLLRSLLRSLLWLLLVYLSRAISVPISHSYSHSVRHLFAKAQTSYSTWRPNTDASQIRLLQNQDETHLRPCRVAFNVSHRNYNQR